MDRNNYHSYNQFNQITIHNHMNTRYVSYKHTMSYHIVCYKQISKINHQSSHRSIRLVILSHKRQTSSTYLNS